jgi:hypothetical protein
VTGALPRRRLTLVLLCAAVACRGQSDGPHDWLIIPATRIGPVHASATEQELIRLVGADRVVQRDHSIGEGMCAPGSVFYPGTADELEVIWTDSTYSAPAEAAVTGNGGRWRTPAGVHVGSTLAELDSLTDGPVPFSGFGWDYGGMANWTEDTSEGNGDVGLQLAPDSASHERARQDPRYSEITGDHTIASDHPLIRIMTIRVERIFIRWAEPQVVRECPGF